MSDRLDSLDHSAEAADSRRLTPLYVAALSTVALLSIGAQLLIQRQLDNGASDSRVINLAGRQRMLSQRLAKSALQLQSPEPAARDAAHAEFVTTLRRWQTSHQGLQQGSDSLRLPGDNSPEVAALFAEITPHFQAIAAAGERLASGSLEPIDKQAINDIQRHEGDFLEGMDAIVSRYVVEAEHRVVRLRRLELTILSLTLLVLLAEGVLIFRPAVRRIRQTFARMETLSERLRHARDEAAHGSAAKTRFLANISHELRTPMTAVLGMARLARESQDDEERDGALRIVEEAGGSLMGLLNDLIDTARIDAGQGESARIELVNVPFHPTEVIERVARMMQSACDTKQIALVVEQPPHRLPVVTGDPRRVEQVLLNLVGNAIKWTDEGSVTIGCRAASITEERVELQFLVRDTGVGIRPDDQQRIFEPFSQLPGAQRSSRGGAGLGLAICRRIADAIGARLELSSKLGIGTTVTLAGDFTVAKESDGAPNSNQQATPDTSAPLNPLDVLVVEDTEVNQLLIRRLLHAEGHRVELAGSGEEAIERYRASAFDLMLVDLQLPGIDGAETVRLAKQADAELGRPSPPMVCVTAHTGAIAAAIEQTFDAVVTKPIERDVWMQTLSDVIGQAAGKHQRNGVADDSTLPLDHELANTFLEVVPPQLAQFRDAIDRGDKDTVRLLAHRFRGQVGYFSLGVIEQKLAELESACEQGGASLIASLGAEAIADLNGAVAALKKRLDAEPNAESQATG